MIHMPPPPLVPEPPSDAELREMVRVALLRFCESAVARVLQVRPGRQVPLGEILDRLERATDIMENCHHGR
jgi:hypothetical protein